MISHQLANVFPSFQDGKVFSIRFTVIATDGTLTEHIHWNTPASLPEREEPYTQNDYVDLAGSIAAAQSLYTQLNSRIEERAKAAMPPGVVPAPPSMSDTERKAFLVREVDDQIAAIITRSTRFSMGYVEREAEAKRYKLSGYVGTPNKWVMDFANAVKIPARMATDIILGQATQLRKANEDLESLRMKKYLISAAKTMELAEAQFNQIIREVTAIGKTL